MQSLKKLEMQSKRELNKYYKSLEKGLVNDKNKYHAKRNAQKQGQESYAHYSKDVKQNEPENVNDERQEGENG